MFWTKWQLSLSDDTVAGTYTHRSGSQPSHSIPAAFLITAIRLSKL
jgi:hypothetical protein